MESTVAEMVVIVALSSSIDACSMLAGIPVIVRPGLRPSVLRSPTVLARSAVVVLVRIVGKVPFVAVSAVSVASVVVVVMGTMGISEFLGKKFTPAIFLDKAGLKLVS